MTAHDDRVTGVRVWSVAVSERSTWVVVGICAGGMCGVGELSDGGPVATVVAAAREVVPLVEGRELELADKGVTAELERRREAADSPAAAFLWSTVLGGFSSALADLGARLSGDPLSTALGLGEPVPVRAYANLNRRWGGTDEVAAEAVKAVSAGLTAVKIAPFSALPGGVLGPDELSHGLRVASAMRDALPGGTHLMVDCHHRVPVELFGQLAKGLAPLEPYWVEDLVDVTDPEAMRVAAATVRLPLAGGEHVWDPRVAEAATATGVLDYWLLDPKHAGGPAGSARVANAVAGAMVTFHNPSGPVGTAHAIHLQGLAAGSTWLELPWGEHADDDFAGVPELVAGGRLRTAAGPGVGCLPRDEPFPGARP